jgi:hypothetical protein
MAARHRVASRQVKRVAVVATATATVSALTVGTLPGPNAIETASERAVRLSAAISLLPTHDKVPDITGGMGSMVYNDGQALADELSRALVNGINVAAAVQAAGIDPKSLLNKLLAQLPANLLPGIIKALAVELPILDQLSLIPGLTAVLDPVLGALGLTVDNTLTGLLTLIGLDTSNPLNLSNILDLAGVHVVTAGSAFSALKMLGLDLGWTPATPNSVAQQIDDSPYLNVGVHGLLESLAAKLNDTNDPPILGVGPLRLLIGQFLGGLTSVIPDVIAARVIPTIGVGLGAFSAAMAYQQVIADLQNQPGAPGVGGDVLGSLTVLPMILINNPGRPDGGLFARFGALAALFGIDTVNPTTSLTGVGGLGGITPVGLHLGGANVLPVMVDATYEYEPLSDFASWPNAFTLVNNLSAALSPTYIMRGLTLAGLVPQLTDIITDAANNATPSNPLSVNAYLTLQSKTLPMLEPLYLASDFLNLIGMAPMAQMSLHLANALAPALSILTNIGYSNVEQNPDGTYTRNFDSANVETPFLSFANIDYGRALSDSWNALMGGIQKEFFSGNPTAAGPNVLSNLISALLDGSLLGGTGGSGGALGGLANPLGGLLNAVTGVVNNVVGGLLGGLGLGGLGAGLGLGANSTAAAITPTAANAVPKVDAQTSRLSLASVAEKSTDTAQSGAQTDPAAKTDPTAASDSTGKVDPTTPSTGTTTDQGTTDQGATDQGSTDAGTDGPAPAAGDQSTGPKHAKPEGQNEPGRRAAPTAQPRHAKPDADSGSSTSGKPSLNVVRNSTNASPTKEKTGTTGAKTGGNGSASTAASEAGGGSESGASDAA